VDSLTLAIELAGLLILLFFIVIPIREFAQILGKIRARSADGASGRADE
jgi:hypothetical protein